MGFVAYHKKMRIEPNGESSVNLRGDVLVFDKVSLEEALISVNGDGSMPMRQGDKITSKDGAIGNVTFYNPSNSSNLELEIYVSGGGVVASSRMQMDGGVSTRKGNGLTIENVELNTATRTKIADASISRNGLAVQCFDDDVDIYTAETGGSPWTLKKGSTRDWENGAELWGVSKNLAATIQVSSEA